MSKEIKNLVLIFGAVVVMAALAFIFIFNAQPKYVQEQPTAVTTLPMVGNLAAAHSFSSGPIDAKVTVVEFFDPECEACAAVAPVIKKEMKSNGNKIRWVFRYMAYHANSKVAIHVLEAARKQNLFLETQTALFENQKTWGEKKTSTEADILKIAGQVKGLDPTRLKNDMLTSNADELIAQDATEGHQAGVQGTPTFFVNGVILQDLNMDELIARISAGLK